MHQLLFWNWPFLIYNGLHRMGLDVWPVIAAIFTGQIQGSLLEDSAVGGRKKTSIRSIHFKVVLFLII
jgi:hypothetical protein